MSFRLTPLIMKFTVSSRLPAVLNANEPWPRSGADRKPFCGGVTEPGASRPRSTKCRPFSGMSWTVRWLITWLTETVAVSISGHRRGDADPFGQTGHAERHVELHGPADFEHERPGFGPETCQGDRQAIRSGGQ